MQETTVVFVSNSEAVCSPHPDYSIYQQVNVRSYSVENKVSPHLDIFYSSESWFIYLTWRSPGCSDGMLYKYTNT